MKIRIGYEIVYDFPQPTPMIRLTPAPTAPTMSEMRVPIITLENKSRPWMSVPIQCRPSGAVNGESLP